jgi:hypothetical protein
VRLRSAGTSAARRLLLVLALVLAAGCDDSVPPDTEPVLLTTGQAGGQGWRLEGRRLKGELCVSLSLDGVDRPPAGRCGVRRTPLRHLDPVSITVGGRVLAFSAVPSRSVRVRLDTASGAIRIEPARLAAGFPARFFLVDLDPREAPVTVRVFADGGRAVVT